MKPLPVAAAALLAGAAAGFIIGRQAAAPSAHATSTHAAATGPTGEDAEAQTEDAGATGSSRPAAGKQRPATAKAAARPITAEQLSSELKNVQFFGGIGNTLRTLADLQERIRASDVSALAAELTSQSATQRGGQAFLGNSIVLETLAEKDPQKAWELATAMKEPMGRMGAIMGVVGQLVRNNPDQAFAMIDALPDAELRQQARNSAINALAQTDPARAFAMVTASSDSNARWQVMSVLGRWAQTDPEAAKAAVAGLSGQIGDQARQALVNSLAEEDPAGAWNYAKQLTFASDNDPRPQLIGRWAQSDPRAALDAAMTIEQSGKRNQAVGSAVATWGNSDFDAALSYARAVNDDGMRGEILKSLSQQGHGDPKKMLDVVLESMPPGEAFTQAVGSIFGTWANNSPKEAAAAVANLPTGKALNTAVQRLASSWISTGGQPDEVFKWARTLPQGEAQNTAYTAVFDRWSQDDPKAAIEALGNVAGSARENIVGSIADNWAENAPDDVIRWANSSLADAGERTEAVTRAISKMTDASPEKAAAAVAALPQDQRSKAMESLVRTWSSRDMSAAGQWLDKQPAGPAKDASLRTFANQMADDDPQSAMAWANNISDAREKQRAMEQVARQWVRSEPEAARAWISNSSLPPDVRERLMK